jgi:hypothetical protein
VNQYLHLHRRMQRQYDKHEAENSWPSADVKRCQFAVIWTLYGVSQTKGKDVPFAKARLKECMAELDHAIAAAAADPAPKKAERDELTCEHCGKQFTP